MSCLSISSSQAANEIYERKLDVDNEQAEQVDEKRKRATKPSDGCKR